MLASLPVAKAVPADTGLRHFFLQERSLYGQALPFTTTLHQETAASVLPGMGSPGCSSRTYQRARGAASVCVRENPSSPSCSHSPAPPSCFRTSQSSKGKQTKQNPTGSAPRRLEVTQMTQAGSWSTPWPPRRATQPRPPLPSSFRPAGTSPSAPDITGSSLHSML